MGKRAPIQLIVHSPQTEEGKRELARRVSEIHADFVVGTLNKLDCPIRQKLTLLQAVIDTARGICKRPDVPASGSTPNAARNRQEVCL